jgi:hypothetical protein
MAPVEFKRRRMSSSLWASVLAGRLEALGREGRLEGVPALLAGLEPEIERVRAAAGAAIASGAFA